MDGLRGFYEGNPYLPSGEPTSAPQYKIKVEIYFYIKYYSYICIEKYFSNNNLKIFTIMKNGFITVINANGQINAMPSPNLSCLSNLVINTQIPNANYKDYLETYFAPIDATLKIYDLRVISIYSTFDPDEEAGYHYIALKSSQEICISNIMQLLSNAFPFDPEASLEAPEISYLTDTEIFTIKQPYTC